MKKKLLITVFAFCLIVILGYSDKANAASSINNVCSYIQQNGVHDDECSSITKSYSQNGWTITLTCNAVDSDELSFSYEAEKNNDYRIVWMNRISDQSIRNAVVGFGIRDYALNPYLSCNAEAQFDATAYSKGSNLNYTVISSGIYHTEDQVQSYLANNAPGYFADALDGWNSFLEEQTGYALVDLGMTNYSDETIGDVIDSGDCPDSSDAHWKLDSKGTLTFYGSGYTGSREKNEYPWSKYRTQVKTVVFKEGITSVGSYACYAFNNLTKIVLPNSMNSQMHSVFEHCSNTVDVYIPSIQKWIDNRGYAIPFDLVYNLYVNGEKLVNLVIPDGITVIPHDIFNKCSSITSVTIPGSVLEIEDGVFSDCPNLVKAIVSNGVEIIDSSAFASCDKLQIIYVPRSVRYIGNGAFDRDTMEDVIDQESTFRDSNVYKYNHYIAYAGSLQEWKNLYSYTDTNQAEFGGYDGRALIYNVSTPDSVQLPSKYYISPTEFVYNGKYRKPNVTVVDTNGRIIPSSNYTLSYSDRPHTNPKCMGWVWIQVQLKNCTAPQTVLRYSVKPKGTSIKKLSSGKKRITVRWNKQMAKMPVFHVNGYQIQYSTNKSFKSGAKTVTVKGYKKNSRVLKKLKSRKRYYVRIRTYFDNVYFKEGRHYSPWSKAKRIKVK